MDNFLTSWATVSLSKEAYSAAWSCSSRHQTACFKATEGLHPPSPRCWLCYAASSELSSLACAPQLVLQRCTILMWPWSIKFGDGYCSHTTAVLRITIKMFWRDVWDFVMVNNSFRHARMEFHGTLFIMLLSLNNLNWGFTSARCPRAHCSTI
jgi:hypothetical protein